MRFWLSSWKNIFQSINSNAHLNGFFTSNALMKTLNMDFIAIKGFSEKVIHDSKIGNIMQTLLELNSSYKVKSWHENEGTSLSRLSLLHYKVFLLWSLCL